MTYPYCPQCGESAPKGYTPTYCTPCYNTGHWYRLVTDNKDRKSRLSIWKKFWHDNGYTKRQINSIPTFRNLESSP